MTTPNLKEIKDAIATLKRKRLEIIGLQEDLEELQEDFEGLLYDFHNDPAYAEIVAIATEIALLNDFGGSDKISIEQFPVDEPLEKADVVENWEAKDVPHVDEPTAEAVTIAPDAASSFPIYYPTPTFTSPAPELSNEPEAATVGDETNNPSGGVV